MSAFVHFLSVVACLGIWFGLGLLEERLESPYLRFSMRGVRGGTLALVICMFLAAALAHSSVLVIPEESRTLAFVALSLGLGMIGVPIGFLVGLARGRMAEE